MTQFTEQPSLVSTVRPVVFAVLTLIVFLTGMSHAPAQDEGAKPQFDHLFNCMCEIEVKDNGEVDMSANCGRNLSDCTCGFAEKMKRQLRNMDQENLPRKRQIKRMKMLYKQYGNRVLAVPDPDGSAQVLGYVIPPAVIFLGLLMVGSIGWYWLADPAVSGVEQRELNENAMAPDGQADLDREIEREIDERRRNS